MNTLYKHPVLKKAIELFFLQSAVIIYTFAAVMAKKASQFDLLSSNYLIFLSMEIAFLGLFAILWQQIIKKFDITVAYANKGLGVFWTLLWSVKLFGETITIKNIFGVIIILIGMFIINKEEKFND
jgi:multidrug transporter EmrE-like cation transporter